LRALLALAPSGHVSLPTVPRPSSGDVVDLVLDDHRLFEDLLRRLRDETQDRERLRVVLADVLVAHAEAEEKHVYPALVRREAIENEDAEHSEHEHDEGHAAPLGVLEVGDPFSEDFGEALEELTKALAHHMDEEEREVLNPAADRRRGRRARRPRAQVRRGALGTARRRVR
jgi:hypothetical protein